MSLSHYGPAPWLTSNPPAPWTAVYFNRADSGGIGFDRTAAGSGSILQYASQAQRRFSDLNHTDYLLWFHHLPWSHPMPSGHSLWDELVIRYTEGVRTVTAMRRVWSGLAGAIDRERYEHTAALLAMQEREAQWWRDASISYFQSLSKLPMPPGYQEPEHTLGWWQSLCVPYVPGVPARVEPLCKP